MPILVEECPVDLDFLNWIDCQPMSSKEEAGSAADYYGLKSKNTYILNSPECLNLKEFILKKLMFMYTDIMAKSVQDIRITQSWISHKSPGQHHTMHSHPNSFVSGIYYYGDGYKDLPAIRFHKPFSNMAPELRIQSNDKVKDAPCSWDYYDFTPNSGTLVLFPSYLQHSVPINQTADVRKSLAFNSMPIGKLGSENDLTELLFDYMM